MNSLLHRSGSNPDSGVGLRAPVIERSNLLAQLRGSAEWDVAVIGGGATGLGIAVDAAQRGFRTALIEARDFASGTSSRSTKLIHGGVRYLAQGNVKLVREALAERALLLANAPALIRPLKLIVPCYRAFEREFLRIGLGVYDALAGRRGVGDTEWLSRAATIAQLPGVKTAGLIGGVAFWDAQFDDARLAVALMRTAVRLGAVAVNYVEASDLELDDGRVDRLIARDVLTGERLELRARVVFNATGVWADALRQRADSAAVPLTTASRGSHVVLPGSFLPGTTAMMIPKTADDRVLFAIPWHGRVMLGTTDIAASGATWNPTASEAEVEFILETARHYLCVPPTSRDVLATFAGLRPLFSPRTAAAVAETSAISREHAIVVEHRNLVTIVGGKWTTYRKMALDALDQAAKTTLLDARPSHTAELPLDIDQSIEAAAAAAQAAALALNGTEADMNTIARFAWLAARHEQAVAADDVIARRLRISGLDAAAAQRLQPLIEAVIKA
jgi:glycerol-3-phosphate dehydrogenase